MLELTKYSMHELENSKEFFTSCCIIINLHKEMTPISIQNRRNANFAIISDSEIITLAIVGELLMIPSEKTWLRFIKKNLCDLFPNICSRTRFNRTRRHLKDIIILIHEKMTSLFYSRTGTTFIVDSMPIPYAILEESKKETYHGFKLQALTDLDIYISRLYITLANIDDRLALWNLVAGIGNVTILVDTGYISKSLPGELKQE